MLSLQEVSEAYEVLSDDNKRREYDNFGTSGSNFNQRPPGAGGFHRTGRDSRSGYTREWNYQVAKYVLDLTVLL